MTNRGREGTATIGGLQARRARFEIRAQSMGETAQLLLAGEFDLASEPQFREQLGKVRSKGFRRVVLDLRDVTFIDSTGLRLLIGEWERSRKDSFELVFVRGSDAVQRVLEITGLDTMLPVVEGVSQTR